jgi:Ca-activated chloride channel family protein
MALSGDGNYYYIESPQQLPTIFQAELQGLMATSGSKVSLAVEPQEGVTVADVLNDLDPTPDGKLKLPNLVAGMPILVVVRLNILSMAQEYEVCRFRLEWDAPGQPERQSLVGTLCLPAVPAEVWDALGTNAEVQERAALLLMARFKKEATGCLERGDPDGALRRLNEAKRLLASAPSAPEMEREAQAFAEIEAYVKDGDRVKFLKHAKYQAHQRRQSKPYP